MQLKLGISGNITWYSDMEIEIELSKNINH